jgi:hypothetical protein
MWFHALNGMKMFYIKNVTCYQCELSIFLSGSYILCRLQVLSKKLCFDLIKKARIFKSEEKTFLNELFLFGCFNNMSYL